MAVAAASSTGAKPKKLLKKKKAKQASKEPPKQLQEAPAEAAGSGKVKRKRKELQEAPAGAAEGGKTKRKRKASEDQEPDANPEAGHGQAWKAKKKKRNREAAKQKRTAAAGEQDSSKPDASGLTLFVGQVPFSVKGPELQRHFAAKGVQGKVQVRLLTYKDTGKSKGMAFVQFENEEDVETALKLHKSKLQGRKLNVERTARGGGNSDARKDELDNLRSSRDSARIEDMRKIFFKAVKAVKKAAREEASEAPAGEDEAEAGGDGGKPPPRKGLLRSDADDGVLELLGTVPEKVALQKLLEFASQPMIKPIHNRPAFLMTTLRKLLQGAKTDPEEKDALEKFTAQSQTQPPRMEMASGAIVCPAEQKDAVLAALPESWKRPHQAKGFLPSHAVTPYQPPEAKTKAPMLAIHLSPEGAAALRSGTTAAPEALSKILSGGSASFHYGLRAGSSDCAGSHRKEILPSFGSEASAPASSPGFRYIELFAGIGGFRVGLDALGGRCVFASEIDTHARKTYVENFAETPAGDVSEIPAADMPDFDVLTAGFPCQPFSIAGEQEGTGDAKGVLFLEITRLLHAKRPAAFILENVPQIKDLDGGRVMKTIMAELRGAGYAVVHRTLNARPVVPQRRLRLFWVGFDERRGGAAAAAKFQWPAWAADGDRDSEELGGRAWYSTGQGPLRTEKKSGWTKVRDILEPAEAVWDSHELTPVKMEYLARQDQYWNHSLEYHFVNERGAARTLIGSYLKLGRSDQLVAPPPAAEGAELRRPRLFTPRECCRLMGFPDSYKVPGEKRAYHELGNAVCPPVVKAIAERLLETGIIPGAGGGSQANGSMLKKKRKLQPKGSAEESAPVGKKRKRKAPQDVAELDQAPGLNEASSETGGAVPAATGGVKRKKSREREMAMVAHTRMS